MKLSDFEYNMIIDFLKEIKSGEVSAIEEEYSIEIEYTDLEIIPCKGNCYKVQLSSPWCFKEVIEVSDMELHAWLYGKIKQNKTTN